ncbi:hypothetical protein [Moorena producens]|uniref:hypothetical protein n=1 Tax=Moorena producens TaxID=1155739 RepID=UPI003C7481A7
MHLIFVKKLLVVLQGEPHFPPLALGYVAARNAPPCQTTFRRCTQEILSCIVQEKKDLLGLHLKYKRYIHRSGGNAVVEDK